MILQPSMEDIQPPEKRKALVVGLAVDETGALVDETFVSDVSGPADAQWAEIEREEHVADTRHAFAFSVCVYERRPGA